MAEGQGTYELSVDASRVRDGLRAAEDAIAKAGQATERAFGGTAAKSFEASGKAADRFGGTLDRIKAKMGAKGDNNLAASFFGNLGAKGVTAGLDLVKDAASAALAQMGNAVDLASDKAESLSKNMILFGPAAAQVERAAKTAATSVGLSGNAYLTAAGNLGNLFTTMEIGQQPAADMSQSLITLAGDMASFNNADPSDVLAAMQSGLVGETEPLRKFGVMLNEASIRAKAMELGLADATGALTPAAKAQASYALILEQTAQAQGDFARTSSGKANQDRINAARMEDAWTRVGAVIAPIAAQVMPMLADAMIAVVDTIGSAIEAVGKFVAENKGLFDILGSVASLIGETVVGVIGVYISALQSAFGVISGVIGGVFDIVKSTVSGILAAIASVIDIAAQVPGPWQEGAAAMRDTLNGMKADVESWGKATASGVATTADGVTATAGALPGAVGSALADGAGDVATGARTGIKDPIANAAAGAVKAVKRSLDDIDQELKDQASRMAESSSAAADAIWDPQIDAANIAQTKIDLAEQRRIARSKGSSKEEVRIARGRVADLEKQLFQQQNDVIANGEQSAKIAAFNATYMSKEWVRKYRAASPAQKQAMDDARDAAAEVLEAGADDAGDAGRKSSRQYAGGVGNAANRKAARDNAADLKDEAKEGLQANYTLWGANAGAAWARGVASQKHAAWAAARALAGATSGMLEGGSPTREGPLHFVDRWGEKVGQAWADGLGSQGGYAARAGATIAAGVARALSGNLVGLGAGSFADPISSARLATATAGALAASGQVNHGGTVRHVLELSPATVALMAKSGMPASEIADTLRQSVDLSGLYGQIRHVAGSR